MLASEFLVGGSEFGFIEQPLNTFSLMKFDKGVLCIKECKTEEFSIFFKTC